MRYVLRKRKTTEFDRIHGVFSSRRGYYSIQVILTIN